MKYKIYLGLNDKNTKTQLISTEEAYDKVYQVVGDNSIQEITGFYQGIREKTFVIEKFEDDNYDIAKVCKQLTKVFNQECVIYETVASNGEFVYA